MGNLTIAQLQEKLQETNTKRQHGKLGIGKDNEKDERLRLYNNLKARESRARKKALLEQQAELYGEKQDEFGIRAVDERRYKACFTAGYIDVLPELGYVRRMTGLNDLQIGILQKRFGLYPNPAITDNIKALKLRQEQFELTH